MLAEQAQPWTWTVPEVLRMVEVGLLDEDDRAELIEGELVVKRRSGGRHVTTINRLTMKCAQAAGDEFTVSVQNPLLLGSRSLPEPDLALHRAREDYWVLDRLPEAKEIVLVIEVADTTVASDRRRKIPLYAQAVEVYTEPLPDGWGSKVLRVDGQLAPHLAPQLELDVLDVLRARER